MVKSKKTETQSSQLNLTLVALVALVAIFGLAALVLNGGNAKGVQPAIAKNAYQYEDRASQEGNVVGGAVEEWAEYAPAIPDYDKWGSGGGKDCSSKDKCAECLCKNSGKQRKCISVCG